MMLNLSSALSGFIFRKKQTLIRFLIRKSETHNFNSFQGTAFTLY